MRPRPHVTRAVRHRTHRADVQTAMPFERRSCRTLVLGPRRLYRAESSLPLARAATSCPSQTLPLGDDELVQLVEGLAHSTRAPRGDGSVESFLRGIEIGEDPQR